MHTDWSSLSLWFFKLWWFWLTFNKKTSQQMRILHKTYKKTSLVNCWPSGKYVHLLYMYSILGRAPFALITAFGVACRWSVCGTAEVVWKPRFLWQWPSAHLHFLVSCFSFSSWHRFSMGFRSGEFAGQTSTPTPWSFNQLFNCFWQCGQVSNPAGKWNQHL